MPSVTIISFDVSFLVSVFSPDGIRSEINPNKSAESIAPNTIQGCLIKRLKSKKVPTQFSVKQNTVTSYLPNYPACIHT